MSGPAARRLVLILLLAVGVWVLAGGRQGRVHGAARWPQEDSLYAVDGWQVGPAAVQEAWGVTHVRRELWSATGTAATVILSTNTTGKGVFGNAEVPLLGAGYAIAPAPAGLLPATRPGRGGRVATVALAGGPEAVWLLCYAYGGRGGLVPDAARGWGLVLLDAALGRDNDYFLLRVLAREDGEDGEDGPATPPAAPAAREVVALTDALVARLTAWYAA
jgi:hypothetical protein